MVDYPKYISSSLVWKAKRAERLAIDGHRCVVCKHDGSEYRLEVHHLTYERLGDEDALHDLVTACSRCHPYLDNIWKEKRYAARSHTPSFVEVSVSARMELQNGMASTALQVDFLGSPVDAQRGAGEPNEQVASCSEEDYVKKSQDRR